MVLQSRAVIVVVAVVAVLQCRMSDNKILLSWY